MRTGTPALADFGYDAPTVMRMPFVFAVAIVLGGALFSACVGDDPGSGGSSSGTSGSSGSSGSSGTSGTSGAPEGCKPDEKQCDGICVKKDDPKYGCGADTCTAPCQGTGAPNTVPSCNAGACATGCAPGFDDCDGDLKNGCETNTQTEVANCGKCGNKCGDAHATAKTCTAGMCVFTCEAGWLNCASDADGCNKNVATDAQNCGKCGRDCLGGTCSNRECSILTLASGQLKPNALAVDGTSVYFVNEGNGVVNKMNKDGTGLGTIVPFASGVESPQAIATDGTNIFWANYNVSAARKLRRASITGAAPADVDVSHGTFSGFLAMGGGKVVWTNRYGTDHVYKADANGTNVAIVATGNFEPGWVAADATHIYWASYGNATIYKTPIGAGPCTMGNGGTCQVLTTANSVYALAIDANNVYFTELVATGAVRKISKNGGAVTTLATGQPVPQTIATDGVHVYWGNFGNAAGGTSIRRAKVDAPASCAAAGCEHVATLNFPNSIALDDKAIYFVDQYSGGGVFRRAK